jgi:hypothetical protein
MAQQSEKQVNLAELVLRSEAARLRLGEAHAALRHKLDVPARLKDSLKAAPTKWIGGSVVAGIAASLLLRPKKKKPAQLKKAGKPRGFLFGLVVLAFTMVKPVAKIYATKLVKDYLKSQLRSGYDRRQLGARNLREY